MSFFFCLSFSFPVPVTITTRKAECEGLARNRGSILLARKRSSERTAIALMMRQIYNDCIGISPRDITNSRVKKDIPYIQACPVRGRAFFWFFSAFSSLPCDRSAGYSFLLKVRLLIYRSRLQPACWPKWLRLPQVLKALTQGPKYLRQWGCRKSSAEFFALT